MSSLHTTYLGIPLRSPIVAAASPATGTVERLQRLEQAGAAAVVLPSLFEEQVEHDMLEVDRMLETGAESFAEAMNFFPDLEDYNTGPDRYLILVEQAKAVLEIPVIASLNGTSTGGWVRYARMLQSAGADALELNLYLLATDARLTGAEIEAREIELVSAVCASVDIPVSVKIGPYYTSLANFGLSVLDAGAAGLVLFNRFYQPDLDLESLEVTPTVALSTSAELRLPLLWVGMLRDRTDKGLAATTGIHNGHDAAKLIAVGADVVALASSLLHHGPGHVGVVERQLSQWLDEHDYDSVGQLRGSASYGSVPDPEAFARANYLQVLASYSTPSAV